MKAVLAAVVVLALAAPALALEGRYTSGDDALGVTVRKETGGRVVVVLEGTQLGAEKRFDLVPSADGALLTGAAAPLGWYDRLMGREPDRLPFDGRRLTFAAMDEARLVLTSLIVDHRGHPTLDRFELTAEGTGVSLLHQRVTKDGVSASPTVVLEERRP